MRVPSPSIPWASAESVPTRAVSPSPAPSHHGGSVSPTPIGAPGAEPLIPVSVRSDPYHRNFTRGSPSKNYNTVVAPMPISSSQSKQTLGSPPTRDNFQYAPYSYTT